MSNSKFYKVVDIVLSPFKPYDDLWQDFENRRWVSLANRSLDEMVDLTIQSIKERSTPKNILVLFFQKYIGGISVEVLKGHVWRIVREAREQRWNKVCFSTCWFVPSHEKVWGDVKEFNSVVHEANVSMGVSKVSLHRSIMSPVSPGSYKLRNRCAMWLEFQLGLALGMHLSHEGVAAVVKAVVRVLNMAFKMGDKLESKHDKDKGIPPSLSITPGWNKNVFMRQMMADRGLIPSERRRGERRMQMSSQSMRGSEEWWVFKTHGPLERFNQREGMLEAMILLLKRSDKDPVWVDNEVAESECDVVVVEEEVVVNEVVVENEVAEVERQVVEVEREDLCVDDGDSPYDPEEWVANRDLEVEFKNELAAQNQGGEVKESGEASIDDEEDEMEVVVSMEKCEVVEKGEPEKPKKREKKKENYYEEADNDVEWLLERVRNTERKYKVEKEKCKAQKLALQSKEIEVMREKATVRLFKGRCEEKDKKIEELEEEVQRVNETWRFLRTTSKARSDLGNIKSRKHKK